MKSIDEFIINILDKDINTPIEYEQAIQNSMKNNNINRNKHCLIKTVISTLISVFIFSGFVFASYIAYEKIWRMPKELTANDFEITAEDKINLLDNKTLEEKAIKELEQLGYINTTIKNQNITKDAYDSRVYFQLITISEKDNDELSIMLDAKNGEFISFGIINKKLFPQYTCTTENAKKIAEKMLLDLNLITEEYKITDIFQNSDNNNSNQSSLYQITFSKEYNGIINKYEGFCIEFIPIINKITLLNKFNEKFDNNPIKINEDEAKKIAESKNRQLFRDLEITSIDISLSFERANEKLYLLENGINETSIFETDNKEQSISGDNYKKDLPIRKVYRIKFNYKENKQKNIYTEYFIDTTTGEIIGGKIEQLKELIQ